MGYDIQAYGAMMADSVRQDSYFDALRRSVKPGAVVIDIGSGTGVHALLAAQLGARRVIAIEPSGAIEAGRAIARANGLDGQIEFIQAPSQTVQLDEKADVVVSDLRGRLPLLQNNMSVLSDARRRFLAPHGTFIPLRDDLMVAAFDNADLYNTLVSAWDGNPLGLDMSSGRELVLNQMHSGKVEPAQLLTESTCWATLDYRGALDNNVRGQVALRVQRPSTVHGLALWFDATLVEGVTFSTGPGRPDTVYGRMFVPLLSPVPVNQGDELVVELRGDLAGEDYVWTWRTTVDGPEGTTKESFEQSTLFSWPLSPEKLHRRRSDRTFELGQAGQVNRCVLNGLDAGYTLGEIARALEERFPEEFRSHAAALGRAASLAEEFGV